MNTSKPVTASPGDGAAHLVIWLDHRLARLYVLTHGAVHVCINHNPQSGGGNIHHHAGTVGSGHVALDENFLRSISDAIGTAREILIVGPADAKTLLKSFLDDHKPLQAANVVAVEALDHLSDGEIVHFAREFFERKDRMITPTKMR